MGAGRHERGDATGPAFPGRRARTGYAAAASLVFLTPWFFFGGATAVDPPWVIALQDLGHVLYFAIAAWFVWTCMPACRRHPRWFVLATFSLVALVAGAAIEAVQYVMSRDADWRDVARDLLGVWVTWFLILRIRMPGYRALQIATFVGVALVAEVPVVAFMSEREVQRRLPMLADFETASDAANWAGHTELSHDVASHGSGSLKVTLDARDYPGTAPVRIPRDWRRWSVLAFDAYNPGPDSIEVTIIVGDRRHYLEGFAYTDRYNGQLRMVPGWNQVHIALAEIAAAPARRRLDLSEIVTLILFSAGSPRPHVLYYDHFRLE
jgi:VanZ family protein